MNAMDGLVRARALCEEWQGHWGSEARRSDLRSRAEAFHAMAAAAAVLRGLIDDEIAIGAEDAGRVLPLSGEIEGRCP